MCFKLQIDCIVLEMTFRRLLKLKKIITVLSLNQRTKLVQSAAPSSLLQFEEAGIHHKEKSTRIASHYAWTNISTIACEWLEIILEW